MYTPMFVPPRPNRLLMRIANAGLPALAQLMASIREVHVPPQEFARLEALKGQRAVLSPNHPTGNDPYVLFWLSRMLGRPFYYLAAREVLDGPQGWMMNHLGTYSVIRGVPDRESLRYTRKLLAEQDSQVVIFPEGEIYEHNDTLLAFQSGVAQIGFWVLEDLERTGKEPVMPILPVAVKYLCIDHPRLAIENSLRDLERALDLQSSTKLTSYQRLRRIGDRVLCSLERQEELEPQPGEPLTERIPRVRQKMLGRVAQAIGTEVDHRLPPADQLHRLFHDLKRWVGGLEEDPSAYDERLYRRRVETAAPLFHDLQRLQNFIAVTGDYVAAQATAERFLDVLGRLEREVCGKVRHRVPRIAHVRIAPPIRLEHRLEEYRRNKRQVVTEVTREMESAIRSMLQELTAESTPIALDA